MKARTFYCLWAVTFATIGMLGTFAAGVLHDWKSAVVSIVLGLGCIAIIVSDAWKDGRESA